jgi:phosphoenolpyruvate carboxykinase (GTP)
MKEELKKLFDGSMRGRTMYVVPYCMGPLDSPASRIAVQITDSAYVALSMKIMTRVGTKALEKLDQNHFVQCLHSVGVPKDPSVADESWPCNPEHLHIAHFPETKEVWSFGSGYGGNALLNKKCFALRLASEMAKEEGWLAEHMLIVGVTNPEGVKRYFVGAFPSACGKTNLAMLSSNLEGWKVECVGDDIAWMRWAEDGKLYAINPEAGFFGVAPGTSIKSNPSAMRTIEKNTIFTNVALTDENDVWWEGMTDTPPKHAISWTGESWTRESKEKAAHPNSRFTVSTSQCPVIDPNWENPQGVPISGILFGGRRSTTVPLVRQASSWDQGVFFGATMTSETTAAAKGKVGELRYDPFAMRPFCGYNMGDYFSHWLSMEQPGRDLPGIFYVNWFQKGKDGAFLWPGFGDNIRVIKWCFDRLDGKVEADSTPIGDVPYPKDLDLSGLDISPEALTQLLTFDVAAWQKEAEGIDRFFADFDARLPEKMKKQNSHLKQQLKV